MRKPCNKLSLLLVFTFCAFYLAPLAAAEDVEKEVVSANYVEAGANYHKLSDGFPSWKGLYVEGSWQQDEANIWDWQVLWDRRWDNTEQLYGGGITHIFNEDWYGSLHGTYSNSGFFFNKYGVDALIHRKFLPDRNLVGTLGLSYYEAKDDIHVDRAMYIGAAYYFSTPWVIEAGYRRNRSSPGPEYSSRYKLAAMYGRDLDRLIVAELEWGREAYQLIAPTVSIVNFTSERAALTLREWIRKDWGVNATVEYYTNSTYNRRGVTIGVFKHF